MVSLVVCIQMAHLHHVVISLTTQFLRQVYVSVLDLLILDRLISHTVVAAVVAVRRQVCQVEQRYLQFMVLVGHHQVIMTAYSGGPERTR